jgi:hypothetical protein
MTTAPEGAVVDTPLHRGTLSEVAICAIHTKGGFPQREESS